MDWHEVATACIGLLFAIGGYLWTQSARQVHELNVKMDRHIQDDNLNFSRAFEKMSDNQIELLKRISGRWTDDDRRH